MVVVGGRSKEPGNNLSRVSPVSFANGNEDICCPIYSSHGILSVLIIWMLLLLLSVLLSLCMMELPQGDMGVN